VAGHAESTRPRWGRPLVNRLVPRRVLVHAMGALGERLAGPEIRALEFAKALSVEYEVTLAAERARAGECEGIPVVPSSRLRLMREAAEHDAVISACLPPYLLALGLVRNLMTISDLYDPHEHELATLDAGRELERELRARLSIQALQLRHADIVLCASERQRAALISNANSLLPASAPAPKPIVMPFGIPDPPAPTGRRPLREHFPQIVEGDKLVMWWGSVWRWLDAATAIRAFARMAGAREDIKLVITAGRPPSKSAESKFDAADEMRALAEELGVLGRTVLFLDTWIPYAERYDYLRDADIGLTLHHHAEEAHLAARARYMDYLAAELPCVLGRGDETAEDFGAAGFATLLEQPTPEVLADTLIALAEDPEALVRAQVAGAGLAAERHWSAVGAKLRATISDGQRDTRLSLRRSPFALLGGTSAYYARQATDRIANLTGAQTPSSRLGAAA
jgi:glycosyltransferase involved in cell wall biosynthesis